MAVPTISSNSPQSFGVLVCAFSAPELTYLAGEVARRGRLRALVRRYANRDRWWERALARVPAAGSLYARTLGLRRPPAGIDPRLLSTAGTAFDMSAAVIGRVGLPARLALRASARLHAATQSALARHAGNFAATASPPPATIVAGSGVALEAFRSRREVRKVLNYSSAHHAFQERYFAECTARQPEFADLQEDYHTLTEHERQRLDQECELADCILTGSSFASASFEASAQLASKTVAVPYGVDTVRFHPNTADGAQRKFRVVYVGRISARKGIGYLLQAYQRFRRPDSELQMVGRIVGNADCLRPYATLFEHVAHLPQSALPKVYRNASVFVFPSLLEGLGLVVLEAMACGCPVIVSSNGPADVVRDGVDGIVVPAGNTEAIHAALERLYADPNLRLAMARNARQHALAHGWQNYARRAADVVLAGAGP